MRTYADIIADVRLDVADDSTQSRWDDAQILRAVGKAIRRAAHVLWRNDIEFGRSKYAFATIPGQYSYTTPADFMAPYGLYREDTNAKLQQESGDSWEQLSSPGEASSWFLEGDNMLIAGTPTLARQMVLRYWVMPETSDATKDDPSPWDGRLDDLIAEYAALRLKNIDEMSLAFDAQLLQDLENNILATYGSLNPQTISRRGWMA